MSSHEFYAGKTVLVTGAASGIGRGIALHAASAGAKVMLGDVAVNALATTTAEIAADGRSAVSHACDVRSYDQLLQLFAVCKTRFGIPDVVFANAGVEGPVGDLSAVDELEFQRVLDINVMGTWRTMKAVLPDMVARGSGSIVATASVAGLVGAAGVTPYVTSKHAVVGLVRSAAVSLARSGVRINAVCPGMIDTAMLDRLGVAIPNFREALLAAKPMGRLGQADEVAAAALWLGSDQASFVTGHTLVVDGGFVAQ